MPEQEGDYSRKKHLEAMRTAMETDRSSFIALWKKLNDYILPMRGRFSLTDGNRGDRRSDKIIDSTATLASRTLSSGMMSGITSPARQWFKLTTPDPDLAEFESVKSWLHLSTERMRSVLSRSNFYNRAPTLYRDLGVFGTGGVLEVEDDHKVVRFIDMPVGSFCIGLLDNGMPGVLTREFRMTVRQLVKSFGKEKCSEVVQNHYEKGNLEVLIEVVHVVHPNTDFNRSAYHASESMPFYSCHYEKTAPERKGRSVFLRESGFEEFLGMFPRWEVTGDDVYGTDSPGISSLGDVKMLQQGEKLSLQAVEKIVKPPMVGPPELRNVRASILPSDITYLAERNDQKGFRPAHEVRFDVDKLEGKQQQTRQRIERAFYADLFLMISRMDDEKDSSQPVTAAEIYERHEEKLLALGPVLEQLNQDLLDPVIDRTFNIMLKRGLIPEPPEVIQGVDLKVEYMSMMHQAQKSQELGGLRSTVAFTLEIAAVDPSAMDVLNTDNMIRRFGDSAGTPPDSLVSEEDVAKIRKARADDARAAKQSTQMKEQASAVKDLAAAPTDGNNALTDMARSVTEQAPAGVA